MKTPKRIPERHGTPYARETANETAHVYTPPPAVPPAPVAKAPAVEAPPTPSFDKGDAWPKAPKESAQYDPSDDR